MNLSEITAKLMIIDQMTIFCEKIDALKKFEPEYKQTDFYKDYKINLFELYKMYVQDNLCHFDSLFAQLQQKIREIDFSVLVDALNEYMQKDQEAVNRLIEDFEKASDKLSDWGKE